MYFFGNLPPLPEELEGYKIYEVYGLCKEFEGGTTPPKFKSTPWGEVGEDLGMLAVKAALGSTMFRFLKNYADDPSVKTNWTLKMPSGSVNCPYPKNMLRIWAVWKKGTDLSATVVADYCVQGQCV